MERTVGWFLLVLLAVAATSGLAGHVPARYSAAKAGLRVAMGEDVWDALAGSRRWSVVDPMGRPEDAFREMTLQVRAHMESLLCRTARVQEADNALEAGFDVLFSVQENPRP